MPYISDFNSHKDLWLRKNTGLLSPCVIPKDTGWLTNLYPHLFSPLGAKYTTESNEGPLSYIKTFLQNASTFTGVLDDANSQITILGTVLALIARELYNISVILSAVVCMLSFNMICPSNTIPPADIMIALCSLALDPLVSVLALLTHSAAYIYECVTPIFEL